MPPPRAAARAGAAAFACALLAAVAEAAGQPPARRPSPLPQGPLLRRPLAALVQARDSGAAGADADEDSSGADVSDPKGGVSQPSSKQIGAVLDTLKDIVASVESEEKEEAKNYGRFMDWCKKETASLKQTLAEAQDQGERSGAGGKEVVASLAHLEEEVKKTAKQMAEINQVLEQANTVRRQEESRFQDDMTLNLQSMQQVEQAIKIVSSPGRRKASMLQGQARIHLDEPGESSYVLGIMKGIKEKLDKTRSELQSEEDKKKGIHASLVAAKKAQLRSLEDESSQKKLLMTEQKIDQVEGDRVGKHAAQKVQELTKLLKHTEDQCAAKTAAYKTRSEDRVQEKAALREAIDVILQSQASAVPPGAPPPGIAAPSAAPPPPKKQPGALLEEEDAPSFIQLGSDGSSAAAPVMEDDDAAWDASPGAAPAPAEPQAQETEGGSAAVVSAASFLSELANNRQAQGAFEDVREVVNKLIGVLKQEQKDEDSKKGYCNAKLKEKTDEKAALADILKEVNAQIDFKSGEIKTLDGEMKAMEADIKKMQDGVKEAGVIRKKEKETYEAGEKDRKLAVKVLKQAIQVMKQFYATQDKTSLIQAGAEVQRDGGQFFGLDAAGTGSEPAPQTWDAAKSTRHDIKGQVVIEMMDKVASEIEKEQLQASKEEADAAAAHEALQRDSRDQFDRMMAELTERAKTKAKLMVHLNVDKETLSNRGTDLKSVDAQLKSFHEECDTLLKNADKNTRARNFELAQMKRVMDLLAGATM